MATSIITPDDVAVWVRTAVQAAIPEFEKPIREGAAIEEKVLVNVVTVMLEGIDRNTRVMLQGIDRNTRVMQTTIANQGRLFICMGMCGFILSERTWTIRQRLKYFGMWLCGFAVVDRLVNGWLVARAAR
eukprot:TRINITY_DN58000_c0_g1_i1.p2 TRINITY_DN58000_c0_g1~~TRINITY_DN58000_c0_g1_i1.p2  ORF type:complete len:130 (-),score=19.78 TRINITY_DN58000_c0_g1_i1:396-785(-)